MNNKSETLQKFTFAEHLTEFKKRLIFVLIFFIIAIFGSYHFKDFILELLTSPLKEITPLENGLIFTHISEPFFVYIKLTLWSATLLSIPFIMSQLYMFAKSGLYKNERIFVLTCLIFGIILFFFGMGFVYYFLMPNVFKFFLSFADSSTDLQLYAKISQYFDFCLQLMLAFGLAFQMPIVLLILNKIGVISCKSLENKRKYSIIIIALAAAVLTPPDVFTQIALIIPLISLYELTIILLKFFKNSNIK